MMNYYYRFMVLAALSYLYLMAAPLWCHAAGWLPMSSVPSPVGSDMVTMCWEPPKLNVDGTECTDLAGYRFYCSIDGAYIGYQELTDNCLTILRKDCDGAAVTAFDTSWNESPMSEEAVVPKLDRTAPAPPGPPQD